MFYHRVSVMEAGVITPVLPVLPVLLSAEQEPRQSALGVLESFLVRRMICSQSTMGFNRLVLELVNQLHEGGMENVDRTTAGFSKGLRVGCDHQGSPSDTTVPGNLTMGG